MKIVGILLIAVISGFVAAGVSLASGGSLWASLGNYLAAGMIATMLGLGVVIWRAIGAERPRMGPLLTAAHSASK